MRSHEIEYRIIGDDLLLQSMPIRKLIQAVAPYSKNAVKEGRSIRGQFLER